MADAPTILQYPLFTQLILPFLLVFTVIFAILDKTKIFGEGKRQINAIIALVIGLLFISFTEAVGLTVRLMGVLAVVAIILLVFIVLFAFASSKGEFEMPKGLKITFGILIGIVLIVSILVFTGNFDFVFSMFTSGSGTAVSIVFIAVIIAAVALVLWGGGRTAG